MGPQATRWWICMRGFGKITLFSTTQLESTFWMDWRQPCTWLPLLFLLSASREARLFWMTKISSKRFFSWTWNLAKSSCASWREWTKDFCKFLQASMAQSLAFWFPKVINPVSRSWSAGETCALTLRISKSPCLSAFHTLFTKSKFSMEKRRSGDGTFLQAFTTKMTNWESVYTRKYRKFSRRTNTAKSSALWICCSPGVRAW